MRFALIGNPGVGKSTIFNQLTGLGVEINRYPGSVVALEQGSVCYKNEKIEITDLPGIYSLDGSSDEEALVRTFIEERNAACLIAVLDATRLERNLYLLLQVAEYRMPMIAVVNKIDEAERSGLAIDTRRLSELLGIEVIAVAARQGRNIDRIVPAALVSARPPGVLTPYDHHIEAALTSLEKTLSTPRHRNLLALQGVSQDPLLRDSAESIAREIEQRHRMSVHQIIATNRHNFSRHLAAAVVAIGERKAPFDLDSLLTRTIPGIPILFAILVFVLLTVFVIGSWLEGIIVPAFTTYIIAPFIALGLPPLPAQIGLSLLVALQAGFGIAFPFVLTFYLAFSFLEDTGYMTRAAFLADRAMHRLGLHGEALIPMVIGFGCTVPAIMSIRIL
ncbi:MAG: ferrous iron transporter B, partial [Methanoregula sp.]|nr:ferrous iron transporter B [Methanoregula sp.]